MGSARARRRLIVTADDFGRSTEINAAVLQSHREGILTSASLMVGGEAFAEAVEIARAHPSLAVGLHLTLCGGRAALPANVAPDLVDNSGEFGSCPVATGFRYFFHSPARSQLEREVEAQFRAFSATGLPLDHVNGHLHFHLHPTVFGILRKLSPAFQVRAVRLTREPWERNLLEQEGRWVYRLSHAAIFSLLSAWAAPRLALDRIVHADRVFGLLQNGLMHEDYLLGLLRQLPAGVTEIYSHPSTAGSREELRALTSERLADAVRHENVELIRYQDLWPKL